MKPGRNDPCLCGTWQKAVQLLPEDADVLGAAKWWTMSVSSGMTVASASI